MEGTFVLADIGGYTRFLTGVGIKHGKEITSHLFNGMLKANKGRWKVANIMGDCLFLYSEEREPPEELFGHLRKLYEEFRGAVTDVAARSTCPCGACSRTGDLALKFVVHAGEYDVQRIGGRNELIGPDIIVATRLLKNGVPAREYVLLTPGLSEAAGASGLPPQEGRESYDDVGAIDYVYVDLGPVRAQVEHSLQFYLSEEDAKVVVIVEVDASPDVVWDAIRNLDKVRQWGISLTELEHVSGATGEVGEIYRCVHDNGRKALHLTIGIDVENRRIAEKFWVGPLFNECYITVEGRPIADGRTQACFFATYHPRFPVLSHLIEPLVPMLMKRSVERDMAGLKAFCEKAAVEARG